MTTAYRALKLHQMKSIPSESFWKIGVGQRLDQIPQFKDGVQLLDIDTLGQAVGQGVPSLLITVQEVEKLVDRLIPALGLGAPVNGLARLGSRGDSGLEAADIGPLPIGAGQCHWSNSDPLLTADNGIMALRLAIVGFKPCSGLLDGSAVR